MRRLRQRGIELSCLVVGVAVLAGTIWIIGVDTLVRDLRTLGWGLTAVLLVESLSVAMNTGGWMLTFPRGERPVSVARLFAARLAGDGVNYLMPSATVGGELLRVRLLGAEVASNLRWASVSATKVGQSTAHAMFILLGLAIVLPELAVARGWLAGPVAIALAVGAGTAAVAAGVAFVWLVDHGLWRSLLGAVRRLRLRSLVPESWTGPGRDLDATLARLGSWRAAAALACFLAGWAVGAVEIYLILYWLGAAVSWRTALALETGAVLIDGILFFVPAKIGTQEGGKVLLFAALGLSPARGLTVGIVRRIRELVYAGLGLVVLGWMSARAGAASTRLAAHASPGGCSPGPV